jgi:choline dehydrogenase-like flavoprotein
MRLGRIGHVRHGSVKVQHESEYVVVGAGSAGCVLTARLSEAGHTVTVLEAGMSDIYKWDSLKIHMPAALVW